MIDVRDFRGDIQAAYDALPDYGGIIDMVPGSYDLGDGLVLRKDKNVGLIGPPRVHRSVGAAVGQFGDVLGQVVVRASGGPESMIRMDDTGGVNNTYGSVFRGLNFVIDNEQTQHVISGENWCKGVVEDCGLNVDNAVQRDDQVMVKIATNRSHGDDSSWWRIIANNVRGAALCEFGGDANTYTNQSNRHRIRDNVCWSGRARPAIKLNGVNAAVISGNNIEGHAIGVHLNGCWQCWMYGDGFEKVGTIALLDGASNIANILAITGNSAPRPGNLIAHLTASANHSDNIIVTPSMTGQRDLYLAGSVRDETVNQTNTVIAPSAWTSRAQLRIHPFISEAGP
jgi:hypothetical protein